MLPGRCPYSDKYEYYHCSGFCTSLHNSPFLISGIFFKLCVFYANSAWRHSAWLPQTLLELLRKMLKAFILLNFLRLRAVKLFWILHTETSLIPIKKGHYFLEISVARPEASDPAVLREPAKTSVEDLGAAAKPRDINKTDCQEQHGKIFYPEEKAPALRWSDTPVQKTT